MTDNKNEQKINVSTDEFSSSGCLINLSLTSNREPFTQHLQNMSGSSFNDLREPLTRKAVQENKPIPHNIRSVFCADFTYCCIRLKMMGVLHKNKVTPSFH